MDDKMYQTFLAGKPGACSCCGERDAYAWSADGIIETASGSDHATFTYVWLPLSDPGNDPGYVCDKCIRLFQNERRIEAYYSVLDGPVRTISPQARQAAYELGVRRMRAVMALSADDDGWVQPEAVKRLPIATGVISRQTPAHIWWLLVEALGYEPDDLDPETCGRFDMFVSAAICGRLDADPDAWDKSSEPAGKWAVQ